LLCLRGRSGESEGRLAYQGGLSGGEEVAIGGGTRKIKPHHYFGGKKRSNIRKLRRRGSVPVDELP